jgi:ADP-ribose pyrophosphatase YjhB (NUDIX family)
MESDGNIYIEAVGAIIVQNSALLLLLRRKSPEKLYWTLPGGRVGANEKPTKAILREIKEEIGVDAVITHVFASPEKIEHEDGFRCLSFTFVVDIAFPPSNVEIDNHSEIRWFPIHMLPENITVASRRAIQRYLDFVNE